MKSKICGMKFRDNLEQLIALKPDYIGFIFHPESPRYVGEKWDTDMLEVLPPDIIPVAVLVNMPIKEALKLGKRMHFKTIQLHGTESADYCSTLQDEGLTIIKAIPVSSKANLEKQARNYAFAADFLLLDTPSKNFGGTGQTFDWNLIAGAEIELPWFLSGGLDAEALKNFDLASLPQNLHGFDANSKLEIEPGLKSVELCREFLGTVNNINAVKIRA